jgi:hypothetical protein
MNYIDDFVTFLGNLGEAGLTLAEHPNDPTAIVYFPPYVSEDLAVGLSAHRAALLGLLRDGYVPEPSSRAEFMFIERLGIADGLGMPTGRGSPAWLISVGEALRASG